MAEWKANARLLVCARGVEAFVKTLSERAEQGDEEARCALLKLRDALETAARLCNQGPELTEEQFTAVYDGLLILDRAAYGHLDYPIEVLRSIGLRVKEDCRKLGLPPLDISFLYEGEP